MQRFTTRFELIYNDDSGLSWSGGCGWSEIYEIWCDVFAPNRERALEVLKFWLPRGCQTKPADLKNCDAIVEDKNVSEKEGVLFYSRKLISRTPYSS